MEKPNKHSITDGQTRLNEATTVSTQPHSVAALYFIGAWKIPSLTSDYVVADEVDSFCACMYVHTCKFDMTSKFTAILGACIFATRKKTFLIG